MSPPAVPVRIDRRDDWRPQEFELPEALSAQEPAEARGLARDGVRLMVSGAGGAIVHTVFRSLPVFLEAGDVLVVNRSATVNAAFDAWLESGDPVGESIVVHVSTKLSRDRWVIELRRRSAKGTVALRSARAGQTVLLPAGAGARLLEPFDSGSSRAGPIRLWVAQMSAGATLPAYAAHHGRPIRYSYVSRDWPLDAYQTVFASEPGSAEMPSAGRAFTARVVEELANRGVRIEGLVLHAGVSSLEADESPPPERYHIPPATAEVVNRARERGHRVIAVGTTVIRALETTVRADGTVRPGHGWTDVVVTPSRPVRSVDGLLTGLHAPRASHLLMLESFTGREDLARAYREAIRRRYLWHEFGDLHLLLR